jgi:hypothetical protein
MVSRADPGASPPDRVQQGGIRQGDARTWLAQLGDHFASIGDEDLLATADKAQVLAEAILQLADADSLHGLNVATCGYIVKPGYFRQW